MKSHEDIENLGKARYHLGLAIELLKTGGPHDDTINRIRAAFNRVKEAWLFRQGIISTVKIDRDERERVFYAHAPVDLRRKCHILDERLRALFYDEHPNPKKHPCFARKTSIADLPEVWNYETRRCIEETTALVEFLESGHVLPTFHMERDKTYRPGLWVCYASGPHEYRYMKVLEVQGSSMTVRHSHRSIETLCIDSLYYEPEQWPPDNMTTPHAKRRTWFDLHPQYRQIPLVPLQFLDYNHALYHTCPCCGYPMHSIGPHITFDDDFFFYEICLLCDWADVAGYYDDHNLDDTDEDGANFGHTLRQARANFEKYCSMFAPDDGVYYEYQSNESILAHKQDLMAMFDAMVGKSSPGEIYLLWHMALKARSDLAEALLKMERRYGDAFITRRDKDREIIGRNFAYKWEDRLNTPETGYFAHGITKEVIRVLWVGEYHHGYLGITRTTKRKIRRVSMPFYKILEITTDDMTTPFYVRRNWFELHEEQRNKHSTCPCCGYPTLWEKSTQCPLCGWTDDGQDDHDLHEKKGRNRDYTLAEARDNFTKTLSMFREKDENPDALPSRSPEVYKIKYDLVSLFHQLIVAVDEENIAFLWQAIGNSYDKLIRILPMQKT
jgi:hypothetical protein